MIRWCRLLPCSTLALLACQSETANQTGADDGQGSLSATTDPGTSTGTSGVGPGTVTVSSTAGDGDSSSGLGPYDPPVVFDVIPPPPVDLGTGDEGPVIPEDCEQASAGESTVGCLFYAVDLDQYDSSENDQYAIAVSNVQLSGAVDVVIEQKVGGAWQVVDGPVSVPSLDLYTFMLPDHHHQGSGVMEGGTYRVTAERPIIAYQFSPFTQVSATSDASMLYPASSLDTLAYVPHWGGGQGGSSYITIVAVEDNTNVEVTPTANTLAGTDVPAGSAGVPFMISLDEGDIAEVMASAPNVSLTGTRIESNANHPIGIFTAHECANIPAAVFACDHLEEQLSGVRLWGRDFAAARVPPRTVGNPETSLWQIQASEDGTTVHLDADAAVTGLPPSPLQMNAGETVEFYVGGTGDQPGDFMIQSDAPIAVMNYMTGADNPPASGLGDPAMVQLSPLQQLLPRYVVMVPNQWTTDVLVITRPSGVSVDLDGDTISGAEFTDIDNGAYQVARIVVEDGVHTLEAGEGFSVVVVGYDEYDSYAYLGGTGTGKINPNPPG